MVDRDARHSGPFRRFGRGRNGRRSHGPTVDGGRYWTATRGRPAMMVVEVARTVSVFLSWARRDQRNVRARVGPPLRRPSSKVLSECQGPLLLRQTRARVDHPRGLTRIDPKGY